MANWQERPLVTAAVETALAAPVDTVVVVVGAQAALVRRTLDAIATPRLGIVECEEWSIGQSASLRAGIAALPIDAEGVLVFLGDMPLVPAILAEQLTEAIKAGACAATVSFKGRPAHPIAFSRSLFGEIGTVTGDRGARHLLEGRPDVVRLVTTDPGSVFDVDEQCDLDRFGP